MTETTFTRRDFARLVVISGVGVVFAGCDRFTGDSPLSPEWWLELYADGRIHMRTKRVEMGQGAHSGLRTLLAEELDVDPQAIRILQVPSDPRYGEIVTGGSFTVAGWHERMRRAGATARYMLLQAAAAHWRVPIADLSTDNGKILHATSGRRALYRDFVAEAARAETPPPAAVSLKPPTAWRYIGQRGTIAHHAEIVTGNARYGIDVRLPGMCFAVLARAPVIGTKLIEFDSSAAHRIPGFITATALRGNDWPHRDHCRDAVAVVATNSWAAQRARETLKIRWSEASRATLDSPSIFGRLQERCSTPGILSFQQGKVDDVSDSHLRRLEAHYRQPYLAHAPLEPPNATASVRDGHIEVWCGNQRQTRLHEAIVLALGVKPKNVTVHAELIGGSFGRRLEIDYGVEAAKLAVALNRPVQILWTRTDDLQHGLYRPGSVHRVAARLDERGRIRSFEHRFAAESVFRQQEPAELDSSGSDWTLAAPLVSLPYEIPNVRLEHHAVEPIVPCAWWRGTYWNNVTTAVECFIDELAEAANEDPLTFRLDHLAYEGKREFIASKDVRVPFDPARMRRVLHALAETAGWRRPVAAGKARGLACGIYDAPECHAAVAVEAGMRDGEPALLAATVVVDVGTAVNPEIVKAQAMGGFLMGASAALREQITWRNGEVEQRGFADYPILRMAECPAVEVVIVASDAGFCGVGEIVTPAAMAAVTNALSRLMRARIRSWPILGAAAAG